MSNVIKRQGLEPREVWTPQFIAELWTNIHGVKTPSTILLGRDHSYHFLDGCESILDVGCGWMGYETTENNVGLDICPSMLKLAKRLHPETCLLRGNTFTLPFKNYQFDGVRSSGLLRHIKDWKPALNEMVRVCDRKLAFSHLVSNLHDTHRCGKHQWCVPMQEIFDELPVAEVAWFTVKEWRLYKSVLFLADLYA